MLIFFNKKSDWKDKLHDEDSEDAISGFGFTTDIVLPHT